MKTVFLHRELKKQIYMHQSKGIAVEGKEDHICLLKKYLYELKQSSRQWYKRFNSFIIAQGFNRSNYDVCVYLRKLNDGSFIYLLLCIDDTLIATRNRYKVNKLKTLLDGEFEMKDLGAAKIFLAWRYIEIERLGSCT